MQDLYDEIHLSKSQISREFKKYFNTTPYQYLLNHRIAISKNLLTKTRLSIKEISDSLCFVDEYHFSAIFKKKNGISPTAYRKANQWKYINCINKQKQRMEFSPSVMFLNVIRFPVKSKIARTSFSLKRSSSY